MSQYEFDQLLQKYVAGSCTQQEEKIVLEWYKQLAAKSSITLSESEKAAINKKIWSQISSHSTDAKKLQASSSARIFTLQPWYKVAVAVAIVAIVTVGIVYFINEKASSPSLTAIPSEKYRGLVSSENRSSENKTVMLRDSSVVTLYPQSTLFYPAEFSAGSREVYLEGNAFFDIVKDSTKHFIVHSGGLLTEVLGTSFEVVKDPQTNKVQVSVVTGKVAVYDTLLALKGSKGNDLVKGIIITPNQKIVYNPANNKYITSLVDEPKPVLENTDSIPAEKFVFDDAYLSEVVQSVQDLYGIVIEFETAASGNCHFTGDISSYDLYKKLDIICQSIHTSYEVRGTKILIKGANCN